MDKLPAQKLFDELNQLAQKLNQNIPSEKNEWNKWFIDQLKNNLQEIQKLYLSPFSSENMEAAFQQLQEFVSKLEAAHKVANKKIKPLDCEAWEQEQKEQAEKSTSLLKPNLSKEKYEDYKKDLDKGRHYHIEEAAVANIIMELSDYKKLKKLREELKEQLSPVKNNKNNLDAEAPKLFSDLIREISLIKTKLDGTATIETSALFSKHKNHHANQAYLKAIQQLLEKINKLKRDDSFVSAKTLSLALKEVANARDSIYQSSKGEKCDVCQDLIAIRGKEKYARFKQLAVTSENTQKNRLKK